jgi:hypothetical protein
MASNTDTILLNTQAANFKKHYDSGMMGSLKTANDLLSQAKNMLLVKNLSSFNLLMDRAQYYADVSHDEFQYAMEHHYQGLTGDILMAINGMITNYVNTLDKYEADYAALLAKAEAHDTNKYKDDDTGGGSDSGITVQTGNNELKDEDYSDDDDKAADKKDGESGGEWIPGIKNEHVIYGGAALLALALIRR